MEVPTPLSKVKHIVMVLSGKGGVGKSTVACQLAFTFAYRHGLRVGILDVDLCGPSVPTICGVEQQEVFQGPSGWIPVQHRWPSSAGTPHANGSLQIMSIAFLLPSPKDAVAWRGPKKDAMLKQFIETVQWGELDLLLIDTPPGTSDEHLTLCSLLQTYSPAGAVLVTTPQDVACDDVKKELSLCHRLEVRCLGIVENMSGYVCPYCDHCTAVFSSGGGEKLAEMYQVPFLGAIPLDPMVSEAEDSGIPVDVFCAAASQERNKNEEEEEDDEDAEGSPVVSDAAMKALYSVTQALQDQLQRVVAAAPLSS